MDDATLTTMVTTPDPPQWYDSCFGHPGAFRRICGLCFNGSLVVGWLAVSAIEIVAFAPFFEEIAVFIRFLGADGRSARSSAAAPQPCGTSGTAR